MSSGGKNYGKSGVQGKPDRDSLMALQALLTIRKESTADESNSPSGSPASIKKMTPVAAVDLAKDGADPLVTNVGFDLNQQPVLSPYNGTRVAQVNALGQAQQHIAAQNGHPFVLPNQAPVGYGTNMFHQHGFHAPTPLQNGGYGSYQMILPQTNAVVHGTAAPRGVVPSAVGPGKGKDAPPVASHGTNSRKKKKPTSTTKRTSETAQPKEAPLESVEPVGASVENSVRRKEIEAALRSKPQRGRKRENLSAEERLELTRTRNREHAKSTRVRKKARYQELLEKEQEYDVMMRQRKLTSQRRQCVFDFISTRSRMLHNLCALESSAPVNRDLASPAAASLESQDDNGLHKESRVVSFADRLNSAGAVPHHDNKASDPSNSNGKVEFSASSFDCEPGLAEMLWNVEQFRFGPMGISVHQDHSREGISVTKGISAMKKFDRDLISSAAEQHENVAGSTLSYRVRSSDGYVAVDHEGIGYAEVDVTCKAADNVENVARSIIFKFSFAAGSKKLSSVEWGEIQGTKPLAVDQAEKPSPDEGERRYSSSSSAESSLGWQMSYPSVVSLDQGNATGESSGEKGGRKSSDGGNGPGMHI